MVPGISMRVDLAVEGDVTIRVVFVGVVPGVGGTVDGAVEATVGGVVAGPRVVFELMTGLTQTTYNNSNLTQL